MGMGMGSGMRGPRKAPPIVRKFQCSLEELFTGCTKRMKVTKNLLDASGAVTKAVSLCVFKTPFFLLYDS